MEVKVHSGQRKGEGHKQIKALALLDSGSDHTFCSQNLIAWLGADSEKIRVLVHTMEMAAEWNTKIIDLWVEAAKGKRTNGMMLKEVIMGDHIL